jgi:hypothetical protein
LQLIVFYLVTFQLILFYQRHTCSLRSLVITDSHSQYLRTERRVRTLNDYFQFYYILYLYLYSSLPLCWNKCPWNWSHFINYNVTVTTFSTTSFQDTPNTSRGTIIPHDPSHTVRSLRSDLLLFRIIGGPVLILILDFYDYNYSNNV